MAILQIEEENVRKAWEEGDKKDRDLLKRLFPKEFKPKYPCFKENLKSGLVVLFKAKQTGVVIVPDNYYCIGYEALDWAEDDLFTPIDIQAIHGRI